MTLFALAGGWCAGIVLARGLGAPWWAWLVLSAASLPLLFVVRQRPAWRTLAGAVLLAGSGGLRLAATGPRVDAHHLAYYNDQGFVTVEGLIIDMPDVRDTHVNLEVKAQQILINDEPVAVEGRALVQAPLGNYQYGEVVRVSGQLHTPPDFDGFSYREYLAREGIHSYMQYVHIEPTGERGGSPVKALMIRFRQHALDVIRRLLPDPQASLLAGILLGIESGISPEVRTAFNAVSATHVIAISGSNLVILAGLISAMTGRLIKNPRWVASLTIAGVLVYAVFVGGDAAVIRAAIMTTLALVATQLDRETYGPASLGFAALLMTAINPLVLWDVGFQLSFAATLGLVLYVEPLQKGLGKLLERLFSKETARLILGLVSDAMIVTIAAQITTFPIMLYAFERFSIVSLPVNLLIVPAQAPLMVFGGLAVLAALIVWPLGQILAWGSWLFLTWTIKVVEASARLPFASAEVTGVSPIAIWMLYAILLGGTFYAMQQPDVREQQHNWLREAFSTKLIGFTGIVAAVVLVAAAWSLPDGRLHVTFIDVGDGTATLIETPSGRQILVDGGGSGRKLSTGLGNALPFWDQRLDALVITHSEPSATAGLPALLARYRFDAVITGDVATEDDAYQAVRQALQDSGAVWVQGRIGAAVQADDGVKLTILTAPNDLTTGDSEAVQPLTLMLTYGELRLLLAGSADALPALLNRSGLLNASILSMPDQGRWDTGLEPLLAAVSPPVAVISVDAGNRSGLPDTETLDALAARDAVVYRTDQHGTIEIISDGESYRVKTSR